MTLVITGPDIEEKTAGAADELFGILGGRGQFDDVDIRLLRFDHPDAPGNEQAKGRGEYLCSRLVTLPAALLEGGPR